MTKTKFWLLFLIFLLGLLLRYSFLNEAPPGLNRDEASIGYTSYSLLNTGKDEYGVPWPVSFKSFGDWKLPLYIYMDIPFIKYMGLNDTAVRLPSVILSSFTVLLVFFLTEELFAATALSLTASFLFALSPWSIHLSRNASESTVGIFLTSLGLLLYLRYPQKKLLILLGTVFLALPLFTYHGYHIFTVLLFGGLIFFLWKKTNPVNFWLSVFVFGFLSIFIFSKTLLTADRTKISGLFAIGNPALVYEKVTTDRLQDPQGGFSASVLHNRVLFTVISVIQNYVRGYSPEFLFLTGGGNTQHNIPDFGNLYLWEAPFLVAGFFYLLKSKSQYRNLMLWWLFIGPIAASITKDAPHTNRMAPILPLLSIVVALGFLKTSISFKVSKFLISGLLLLNFIIWTDRYYIHFPMKRAALWGEGYKNLISVLDKNNNFDVEEIVMTRPDYSPYIYFLFYNRTDPLYFQNNVVRYDETEEGFQHVARLDNFTFRRIDWWKGDLATPDRLYIDWTNDVPPAATASGILITKESMEEMMENNKDVWGIEVGDTILSEKVADIKLRSKESMFTLIKTRKK